MAIHLLAVPALCCRLTAALSEDLVECVAYIVRRVQVEPIASSTKDLLSPIKSVLSKPNPVKRKMLERFQGVSYLQVLGALLLFFSAFIVVAVIRRIYFSPISDIPGPLVARFSILWQLWVTATGQLGPAIVALHKKHGNEQSCIACTRYSNTNEPYRQVCSHRLQRSQRLRSRR